MMSSNLIEFDNSTKLVENLSSKIIEILNKQISQKGFASIIVSGGSTPKKLFEKLSTCALDWSKVRIGLVDERVVETTNSDSNENLVKKYFLQNKARNANFISMKNQKELFPFDITILGMGGDAHTASLFPNNEKLKEAYTTRVSSTLYAIKKSENIFLHIEGSEKFEVLQKALKNNDIYKMPISAVLNDKEIQVEVYHT